MCSNQEERLSETQRLDQRFGVDFLTYLSARLVPAAVGMATVMVLTRLFSPSEFGRYSLVSAASGVSLVVLGGWLRECVLRFYSSELAEGSEDAFLALLLAMAAGTAVLPLVAVVAVYCLPCGLDEYRDLLPLAGAWVAAGLLYVPLSSSLQARLRARQLAIYEALRALLGLAFMVAYVHLVSRHVMGAFFGLVSSTLVIGLLTVRDLQVWKGFRTVWMRREKPTVRLSALLGYGLPLMGWALGLEALNLADRFIVNWFHGAAAVGIYSSNYYLADGGAALLAMPLLAAVKPLIMHASSAGRSDDAQRLVTLASRVLLLLFLPCLAAATVLSRRIAIVFLDSNYVQGYVILPLVVAGVGSWSLGLLGHTGLQLVHRTKTMLVGVAICALVNITLNMLVVPRWGYMGAAATTLASYMLYPIFVHRACRGVFPWRFPWVTLVRGAIASAVMGLTLTLIWGDWIDSLALRLVLTGVAPAVYVGGLSLLREFSREDFRSLWGWVEKRFRSGQKRDSR